MYRGFVILSLFGTAAVSYPTADSTNSYPTDPHAWQAPKPGDSRAPCPMLNTLANHGYIPRNGKNIDQATLLKALNDSVNFVADNVIPIITTALTTSTTGNASTFNLADTAKHDVIEHDGSLSRGDIAQGDNLHFNQRIWDGTAATFGNSPTVTIELAAKARAARLKRAAKENPRFNLTAGGDQSSVFESSLYQIALGDHVLGNPPTSWVKVFFQQERFPYELGFKRKDTPIVSEDVLNMADKIKAVAV
ncbi:Cloroperoxidase [Thozetella sp. PMI_491]|nr:Cloroperoxidase [Thozetella sp. PMI_491]